MQTLMLQTERGRLDETNLKCLSLTIDLIEIQMKINLKALESTVSLAYVMVKHAAVGRGVPVGCLYNTHLVIKHY